MQTQIRQLLVVVYVVLWGGMSFVADSVFKVNHLWIITSWLPFYVWIWMSIEFKWLKHPDER